MRKKMRNVVIDLLRDYHDYPTYIKERENELKHPVLPRDENVGGGRAQNRISKPVENLVITINDDRRLNTLKREYDVIRYHYQRADRDTKIILENCYFTHHPYYKVEGLVALKKIHVSRSTAYDLVNKFIDQVAHDLKLDTY